MTAVLWLSRHESLLLSVCALLIGCAVRIYRSARRVERDLNRVERDLNLILGPDRLAHVQQDRAWRRISGS